MTASPAPTQTTGTAPRKRSRIALVVFGSIAFGFVSRGTPRAESQQRGVRRAADGLRSGEGADELGRETSRRRLRRCRATGGWGRSSGEARTTLFEQLPSNGRWRDSRSPTRGQTIRGNYKSNDHGRRSSNARGTVPMSERRGLGRETRGVLREHSCTRERAEEVRRTLVRELPWCAFGIDCHPTHRVDREIPRP